MVKKKIKVVKATIIMRKCEKERSKTKPQKTQKIEIESPDFQYEFHNDNN